MIDTTVWTRAPLFFMDAALHVLCPTLFQESCNAHPRVDKHDLAQKSR